MNEYRECPRGEFIEPRQRNNYCGRNSTMNMWLKKNLLLLITLFGVFLGVIIGKWIFNKTFNNFIKLLK